MTHRVYCFNPGPAALPLPVLEEIQSELLNYRNTGMSVMELSHRSPDFSAIHQEAAALFAEILDLSEDWKVLFLPGGSSTQFFSVPMNFLSSGRLKADYISTGTWSEKAIKEARLFGDIHVAHNAADSDGKYRYVPDQEQLSLRDDAVYLHFTSNNTIAGTQFKSFPKAPDGVFLVADMCSDILWRKFDTEPFGLFYASAQKNLGPAGVTVVAVRKSILKKCASDIPTLLSYKTQVEKNSLFNTGPTFPIYVVGKVLKWIKSIGGLEEIERLNLEKSRRLYEKIDENPDFWITNVEKSSRSVMNVVWRIQNDEKLEKRFVDSAKDAGLVGLKGHRSVGGIRASLYNAMTLDGVDALIDFMDEFVRLNG